MFRRVLAVALLFAAIIQPHSEAAGIQPSVKRSDFVVFDGLLYSGKPDLGAFGLRPIRQMNPPHGASNEPDGPLDEKSTRASMNTLRDFSGVVYLDYEMWPLSVGSPLLLGQSVEKYGRVADIAHEVMSAATIGFYGALPCREYWGLVEHDPGKMRSWQECNRRGDSIAEHVGVIFPSLYTFYDNQPAWDTYAKAMIEAARRYHKPVYVFLWPEFHPSNRLLRGTYLSAKFWRHELDFCRQLADGIVIWGGWQEQWRDDAPWWIETRAFMKSVDRH